MHSLPVTCALCMTQLLPAAWPSGLFFIDEAAGRKGDGDFTWHLRPFSHFSVELLLGNVVCTQGLPVGQEPGSLQSGLREQMHSLSLRPESCPGSLTSREGELGSPRMTCTSTPRAAHLLWEPGSQGVICIGRRVCLVSITPWQPGLLLPLGCSFLLSFLVVFVLILLIWLLLRVLPNTVFSSYLHSLLNLSRL